MTRRDLGKLAMASAITLENAPADAPKYTGALDGFENKVDMAGFDPVAYTHKLHDEAPLRMTFRATTRGEAEAWQKRLRAKMVELVGGFPARAHAARAAGSGGDAIIPDTGARNSCFRAGPACGCWATC